MRFKSLFMSVSVLGVLSLVQGVHAGEAQASPPEATVPVLLNDAFNKMMEDQGRVAFTETQAVIGFGGKPNGGTIICVDPSLPYDDQFKPLKIDGKAPTESQLKHFRGIGGWLAKQRQEREAEDKNHNGEELKIRLNDQSVTPDLVHATVLSEDATSVTYEVPLRKDEKAGGELFDKFRVTARVNKERHEFEQAVFKQLTPLRVKLIAKVMNAEIVCDFTKPDPRYPATITKITQRTELRIFFVDRVVSAEINRSEYKHVTPYDERFGVKLGPIRTIQF